ncbi:MAG: 50S ribosomal protein L29 [Desulfuromonadales bacterium]
MRPNDLRKLSPEDLHNKLNETTKELFNLNFQLHTGRLENTSKLKNIRKDIARINTILAENKA